MKRFLSTEFTVGAFALVGLLIIIYMSLEVNDRGTIGGASRTHPAFFTSVSGLVAKVPVEVSGIAAGFIDKIELADGRAKVTVKIREDIPVYADASLSVRDRGILGDKFLMLNPGSTDQPRLNDGDEIRKTFSESDFEKLTSALGDTADMIHELLRSDEPRGALGKVILNLRDVTGRVNEMVGDNQGRINRILVNLEGLTGDIREITGENKDEIRNILASLEEVTTSLKTTLGAGGSMEKTMASLQNITEKIEKGEGSLGKLINDDTTINNINETVEGLNETLGTFRKIRLSVRYRGEYLATSQSLQNLVGLQISPAPDKYVLFEIVDAPVGETKVIDTTVTSGNTTLSSTRTVQTNDDILFTFLLAKRFWDLTLRFGLLRNEGGVGLDYSLLKDRLVFSVEAFDFGRVNDRVHLRSYATLVLYKHLLLTGGMDDIVTDVAPHNAFFGLGIQFTDDDLKSLVTLAPRKL